MIDKSFDADKIRELLNERALTEDALDFGEVIGISQNMKRGALHRLQPHFVENFFLAAFQKLGGQIYKRGSGRYEITRVPAVIRNKALKGRFAEPIAGSYERICFAKENCHIAGVVSAILVAPTNLLLDAVSDLILEKFGDALRQGTIFIDDNDSGKNFRLLFYVEVKFQDGRRETIAKRLHLVEIPKTGQAFLVNYAPYLDYRSPNESEREEILSAVQNADWLKGDVENIAVSYAIKNLILAHFRKVTAYNKSYLDKLEQAVRGYFDSTTKENFSADAEARSRVEKIAMEAVMKIERKLGNSPSDVSSLKCGYDVESVETDGRLRFIEVKGRNSNANEVTVTKNEILTALNSPENFILAIVTVDGNSARVVFQ